MKKILYIFTLLLAYLGNAQVDVKPTSTENYIHKIVYKNPYTEAQLNIVSNEDKLESVNYFDGLGRPLQSVAVRQGGQLNNQDADIITAFAYDVYGRQQRQYLPMSVSTNTGKTESDAIGAITSFYSAKYSSELNVTTPNPYSETLFEASPLNRVLEQGAPGEDWMINPNSDADHSIKFEYKTNVASEVKKFKAEFLTSNTASPTLSSEGYYAVNSLYKTITKDENWQPNQNYAADHTTEEFKDKQGQVVLKRTYNSNVTHDTYYVYDVFGNLTYVLPPKVDVSNGVSSVELTELCYQYKYDKRNRLIEKKIPGKGWEYIVYNKLDQPVLTQDANLDGLNKWLFTKYDALGRVTYTGRMSSGSDRSVFEGSLNNQTNLFESKTTSPTTIDATSVYYNNASYPTVNIDDLYTINYYDAYINLPSGLSSTATTYYGLTSSMAIKGLPTVSKVKVLETSDWITTVNYYDDKGRPIYVYTTNSYLNTTDIIETKYDFVGKATEVKLTHKKTGKPDIITYDNYDYDHAGRLLSHTQKTNNEVSKRLLKNNYNELGQLESKLVDNGTSGGYDDIVGVLVENDVIKKTSGSGWGSGGLATNGTITGDGYVEYKMNTVGERLMVGLSSDNTNANYHTIDFAIYHSSSNNYIHVYESASSKGQKTTYQQGDSFRIERIGTSIHYKKNGETFYISTIASTGSLLGDIAIHGYNDKISDLKLVDNTKGIQKIDYDYNIRGWLKGINDVGNIGNDLFTFKLNYNQTDETNSEALYNGNISETYWKTITDHDDDVTKRGYFYEYDALNRINAATFLKVGGTTAENNNYNLSNIGYDKNGNIQTLTRNGWKNSSNYANIDVLNYDYHNSETSNRLRQVNDTGHDDYGFVDSNVNDQDYWYDTNGNMTKDDNKDITNISYNHLNLPTSVSINDNGNLGTIDYIYDATGVKLEKKVTEGSSITKSLYAGNFIYEKIGTGSEVLKFFSHPEGYVEPGGSGFDYVYQYKDHLGNVRLSYADNDNSYLQFINSTFESGFDGWEKRGATTNITIEGNRLKANISRDWEGVKHPLNSFTTVAGEKLTIKINFDKGNTMANVRLYIPEYAPSGNLVSYNELSSNMQTGYNEFTYTFLSSGNTIPEIRVDKNNAYFGVQTYFYIDNITVTKGELEIQEENNYYPFGLEHKGYNSNVISENNYFNFVGKELNKSLDYNMLEMDWRHFDPAIGRFVSIDAFAESYEHLTPYHYSENSPIMYSDPTGLFTDVVNEDTGEVYNIDDGYDFRFTVSAADFAEISESGAIPSRLNGAWNLEFWKQVWAGVVNSDGSASDEITAFLITDDINDVGEAINNPGNQNTAVAVVLAIGSGKLKKLKKLARWVKKKANRGKKIPGTKKGGVTFENSGKDGGQVLPRKDANGNPITYTEYDINKAPQHGATRGKERMVVGSDGRTYYTRDHYKGFKEFKD